jgi:S-adenosylmethionine:tRNA ribosyltransferase-isomerase
MEKTIDLTEYQYALPNEKIALYPLVQRDQSKLLVYQNGQIIHSQFTELSNFLPIGCRLFFNNTKVIPARLHFTKETGATIELFLLHPIEPSPLVSLAMEARGSSKWKVVIGNAKRWNGTMLTKISGSILLKATLVDQDQSIVAFDWSPEELTFSEVITQMGATPLPPYLKREVEQNDRERYQTIYSKHDGAVAAPTAGLHFTDQVFADLKNKGIKTDFLTLHVSAGTFQPIKVANAWDHNMHDEQIHVTKANLENLQSQSTFTVAVGTTSLRTLESIYWYGVKLQHDSTADFIIGQRDPYLNSVEITKEQAIENILRKMGADGTDQLVGKTSIYIVPEYSFKVVDALITNFHQPGSTLMLLVAAFIGSNWKAVYDQALQNDYRFLSYGDSSLLFKM